MPDHPADVLIPVADPERAPRYIDLGARIAVELQGELVLLSVTVEEPRDPQEVTEEVEEPPSDALSELQEYAESRDVGARIRQLRARDVAESIVVAAQDPGIGYLIMGWRGDEEGGSSVIGQKTDGLVREADAHTIVMQESALRESERVLLPVLSMSLDPLSLAVASVLAGIVDAPITVLHLTPGAITDEEKEDFRSSLLDFSETPGNSPTQLVHDADAFEIVFEVTSDPAKTLLESLDGYDRLILEARQARALKEKVHDGSHPNLAEEAPCPLVLVRPQNQSMEFGL